MVATTISFDLALNVPVTKLWTVLVKDSPTYLAKFLPAEWAATVECAEGRCTKAGAVRVIKSTNDGAYFKERYEELDEINHSATVKVVEARGVKAQCYAGCKYKLKLNPGPQGFSTTVVSWFEELDDSAGADEAEKRKGVLKQAEAYILSNDVVVA